jgi:SAM-dependent methyltransferase
MATLKQVLGLGSRAVLGRIVPQPVLEQVQLALHAGSRFVCPFCGYHARDLKPFGLGLPVLKEKAVVGSGLRRAGCYKCGSTDRERLVYVFIRDRLGAIRDAGGLRVLHIAPEPNLSRVLRETGFAEYVCGDLDAAGYAADAQVRAMNVLELAFEDDHFDLLICNHVLEHIIDDAAAMRSLYRVLKPGGHGILQVPISANSDETYEDPSITDPQQRELHFGQSDHVRIYGRNYGSRLEAAGFSVQTVNVSAAYPLMGLNPAEDIFAVEKPCRPR